MFPAPTNDARLALTHYTHTLTHSSFHTNPVVPTSSWHFTNTMQRESMKSHMFPTVYAIPCHAIALIVAYFVNMSPGTWAKLIKNVCCHCVIFGDQNCGFIARELHTKNRIRICGSTTFGSRALYDATTKVYTALPFYSHRHSYTVMYLCSMWLSKFNLLKYSTMIFVSV